MDKKKRMSLDLALGTYKKADFGDTSSKKGANFSNSDTSEKVEGYLKDIKLNPSQKQERDRINRDPEQYIKDEKELDNIKSKTKSTKKYRKAIEKMMGK